VGEVERLEPLKIVGAAENLGVGERARWADSGTDDNKLPGMGPERARRKGARNPSVVIR
jgi:hypothetical protein